MGYWSFIIYHWSLITGYGLRVARWAFRVYLVIFLVLSEA